MREFELKITSAPVLRSLHSISFSPEKEKKGGETLVDLTAVRNIGVAFWKYQESTSFEEGLR